MDEVLYACRFVHFTAAMLIFGAGSFRLYALAGSNAPAPAIFLAAFDAWLGQVMGVAAILALVSALALLLVQSAAMAGSPAAAIDPATVEAVLLETHFGRVWCWHLLLAAILVLVCFSRHRSRPVVAILSLALLASLGWVGHAVIGEGSARIAHQINQIGHLLAAGLWLGGLAPLAWVLRRARRQAGDLEISAARDALRKFSQMGYVAVTLITLTGAINTSFLVGSLAAMFDTSYGRLLAFKILLFLAMVVLAVINRLYLAPRFFRDPNALRALGRTVALEQGLGLAVLAIVGVLGVWPPALHGNG
jgi:putative copper resistance protein D